MNCVVPELGENIRSATVVEVFVKAGDTVVTEQALISLETDKAEFELPADVDGVVTEVLVEPGQDVAVGDIVARIETSAGENAPEPTDKSPTQTADASSPGGASAADESETTPVKRPAKSRPDTGQTPPSSSGRATQAKLAATATPARSSSAANTPSAAGPAASPVVRRVARELAIDLAAVPATGNHGRVTRDDLRAFIAAEAEHARDSTDRPNSPRRTILLPDFEQWGPIRSEPMSKLRALTAEQMATSWENIPHVTHHDKADITTLEALRKQKRELVSARGGQLTMTAILLEVIGSILTQFPKFNASIDIESKTIIYKDYVHIGVAVDTDRGLLVPVIRNVTNKSIIDIAVELKELSEKARAKNIRPADMAGATFTITNLGGIGGVAFSPIINPPEVAILGVSRAVLEPIAVDSRFEPRLMLPLSLSYDHRIIDGADAARFTREICKALEESVSAKLEVT